MLAAEIIDAATDLALESGDESAISIRAVAKRVGVTPPSIYLHFADKDKLIDAVCAHYFERLDGELVRATQGIDDPAERAVEQGMTYVRFAVSNPVLYRLSSIQRPDAADQPSKVDEVLAASAFLRFSGTVTELIASGAVERQDVTELVLELWAAAHGIASLMINKPDLPWHDFALAENLLRTLLVGKTAGSRVR